MASDLTAATAKRRASVWRGEKPWHWAAIYTGHVQPRGYRNYWHDRRRWQLHVTPLHVSRDGAKWSVGLCFGARTVLLHVHR
jgi:hypothetical protein